MGNESSYENSSGISFWMENFLVSHFRSKDVFGEGKKSKWY